MFKKNKETVIVPSYVVSDYPFIPHVMPSQELNQVRFVLGRTPGHNKPYALIVVMLHPVSPMNAPLETWGALRKFLTTYDLKLADVDIYLDFRDQYGEVDGGIMEWKFIVDKKMEFIKDELPEDIPHNKLPEQVKLLREKYYKNRKYSFENRTKDLI